MGDGQTDILVQVEELDDAPVDVLFLQKRRQHFKLTCSGCEDHIGIAFCLDGCADLFSTDLCSSFAEFVIVIGNLYKHFQPFRV